VFALSQDSTIEPQLVCQPIGVIHTKMRVKFDTPHQPANSVKEENVVELFPNMRLEEGLRDLEGFERIWLIWWFHKNANWRPLVTPPRGPGKRRGVFATRSPHRPCPIGITSVPLISISGRRLIVGNSDLLDKTPILDIKPYISSVDAFADQRVGWLGDVEQELKKPAAYTVKSSQLAKEQLAWLSDNWGIDFITKVTAILERAPERSRTHRITSPKNGIYRLSSGGWRVYFSVSGVEVLIERVAPGYPQRLLIKSGYDSIPDREAQIEFSAKWGEE
jgi:tRNA (adenine37-N6)-methyltransferase